MTAALRAAEEELYGALDSLDVHPVWRSLSGRSHASRQPPSPTGHVISDLFEMLRNAATVALLRQVFVSCRRFLR